MHFTGLDMSAFGYSAASARKREGVGGCTGCRSASLNQNVWLRMIGWMERLSTSPTLSSVEILTYKPYWPLSATADNVKQAAAKSTAAHCFVTDTRWKSERGHCTLDNVAQMSGAESWADAMSLCAAAGQFLRKLPLSCSRLAHSERAMGIAGWLRPSAILTKLSAANTGLVHTGTSAEGLRERQWRWLLAQK